MVCVIVAVVEKPVQGRRRPVAVDLFAGAGGLSLGLEQAGFDVVAAVEYDAVHAAVHEFNFPLTKVLCRDISRLAPEDLRDAAEEGAVRHGNVGRSNGEIDLVAGGPPCQGFSLMGKRLIDDPRNQLVFHFFRLVKALRPRLFLMENVPGMRIGGHSSILEELIREFEEEGYRVLRPVEILNAADFGVPQDRARVILLGARDDQDLPTYPDASFVSRRCTQAPLGDLPLGPSILEAIGDLPNLDDFHELVTSDEVELPGGLLNEAERTSSPYARQMRGSEEDLTDKSHRRLWDRHRLTSSMRTRHTPMSIKRFADTVPGTVEPVSRFLRLDPQGISNTLRAGTGSERGAYTSPRPIHPLLPRVISVREAARIHSFPDWFRFHRTKWHGFRQIGNAVAPLLGRAVGIEIVEALALDPPVPAEAVELGDPTLLGLSMTEAAAHFGATHDELPAQRIRAATAAAAA
jgi:DNA (cytosine-5)-methyltransferase 1